MPYVITTSGNVHGDELCTARDVISRRAVATLDEAHAAVADLIPDGYVDTDGMPEAGGTIGPLPDGTLIEVEPTTLLELWRRLDGPWDIERDQIIAAFNAAQAVA